MSYDKNHYHRVIKFTSLTLAAAGLLALLLTGCNQTGFMDASQVNSASGTPGTTLPLVQGSNVLAVSVGNCGPNSYFNEPCVTITICTPGTTQCQTIPNVLLDTGSYGLRLFSSVITVPLNQVTSSSGGSLAECTQFGSGAEWGPIKMADVVLGGEQAVQIPIQVVDASFPTAPSDCTGLDLSPQGSGFNGILGVGLFTQDCGDECVSNSNTGIYYECSGNSCGGTTVALDQQVVNPIAALPVDNNGVILQLPSVPSGGVSSVGGNLILGIGTQSNNKPGQVTYFPADSSGNFVTQFNGQTFSSSFIDSGSNALYFPSSSISICSSQQTSGFYCPPSTTAFSATQKSASSSPSVMFQIANADAILNSGNIVFSDIGGSISGVLSSDFDWGLPFFFGKTVYVGISGKSSSLGAGPSWAY